MKYPVIVLFIFLTACGPAFSAEHAEQRAEVGSASGDVTNDGMGGSASFSVSGASSESIGGSPTTGVIGGAPSSGGSTGSSDAGSVGISDGGSAAAPDIGQGGSGGVIANTGGVATVDDGECDVSGLRFRMEPSSTTRTPASVVAAFNGTASFQEVCTSADSLEAYPVFGCCVSTSVIHGRACIDVLLQDLVNPGIVIDACGGSNPDARCGDSSQYRVHLNGQVVAPQVALVGNRYALCITAP